MPSITTWTRLEPRSTDTISGGLQARIHDPLWLLARQWQTGEFRAEDAGSPMFAQIQGEAFGLTRYFAGPLPANGTAAGRSVDFGREPLETLVEKEPATRGVPPDLRFSADAGRHFVRLLELHGVGKHRTAFIGEFGFREIAAPDDEPARDMLPVLTGRLIDGARLYAALKASLKPPAGAGKLPDQPSITVANDRIAVRKAADQWLAWYDSQVSEPAAGDNAWVTSRLEYSFAVSAATPEGEIVLAAPEYVEGRLDWDAFSIRSGAQLGATPSEARQEKISKKLIPAPVTYPGMPSNRWWEFEDAHVQFGTVKPSAQDLASMVFLQFALIFGNDWFLIPLELPIGSISRLAMLNVTDSFGVVTAVEPFQRAGGAGVPWCTFALSRDASLPVAAPQADFLFLPPALGTALESKPIEDVLFLRDEMANMAWAVERIIESRSGDPIDRGAVYNAAHPPPETATVAAEGTGRVVYRLASEVPDYWIPLVPVRDGKDAPVRLQRGIVPHPDSPASEAKGRVLVPGTPLTLHDEEVPREGARVTRSWQYTRWIDGSTHVWMGRCKEPGRGEGSSGLRFDTLDPK